MKTCKICETGLMQWEVDICALCQVEVDKFGQSLDIPEYEALDEEDSEILAFCNQNNL